MIEQLLKAKHNQQSKDINGARADALAQIERASNWVPTHKRDNNTVAYEPVIPDSWVRHNQNLREKSRAKIERAVVDIVQQRRSFSVRDLANSAGVCEKTLYKHKDLWAAQYETLRFMATVGHEYNAVEDRGASVSGDAVLREFADLFDVADEAGVVEEAGPSVCSARDQLSIDWLGSGAVAQEDRHLVAVLVLYRNLLTQTRSQEKRRWLGGQIELVKGRLALSRLVGVKARSG